jgi:phytoene dehydrogenase-like protein
MIWSMSTGADATTALLPALIVGAGPAGLASAACLKQRGIEPLVLEAGASLANSWRHHYDRLRLHTVKQQSSMPGVPFARELARYPTRAEVIAYLEAYAARFAIVPSTGEAVRRRHRGQARRRAVHGDRRDVRRRHHRRVRRRRAGHRLPPVLEEIVAVPDVLDDEGYPRDWKGAAHPGLFFVGYKQPPTGLLREIAIQAEAVAAAIARA